MNFPIHRTTASWLVLFVSSLFAVFPVQAQTENKTPAPAQELLAAAIKTAKAENKTVFVHFGASWCGWCKRLEKFLASPEVGKLMSDHYVLLSLTVQEAPENKALENPGAAAVMSEAGGEKAGLPYYFVLDRTGKKLADSMAMPGSKNIGHPANPAEIQAFMSVIAKTAPHMTAAERAKIADYLTKTMPKPSAQ